MLFVLIVVCNFWRLRVNHLFCLHPANFSCEHFILGVKKSGEYKGVEYLKHLNQTEEKKKKLTLQDFLCWKNEGQFDMIDFDNDEY